IRARVEANEELTQRLQAEERNKYSEVDQSKMLVDLINQRKRYFAKQMAEAKRKKPLTQAQQMTYISSTMRSIKDFVPIESEDDKAVPKLAETRSSKRDTEEELDKGRSRLYDACGVHHVSTKKGMDIYMLVEKEYPLSRGILTQMLCVKLLVDEDSEMCREHIKKKFMQDALVLARGRNSELKFPLDEIEARKATLKRRMRALEECFRLSGTQHVSDALMAYEANRNSGTSVNDGTSGSVRGAEHTARGCSYKEFMTCKHCNFNETKGAVGLTRVRENNDRRILSEESSAEDGN
nr:hypothetical protein [Tanacetum cinerariifolium]